MKDIITSDVEIHKNAREFAEYWDGKGYEKGESQKFWISLLTNVLDVKNAEQFIEFEDQVKLDNTSFIDGYIPQTHVLIEQKGITKDLRKPIKQSDGTLLTPFQQAKRYSQELPYSRRARWIIACNFKEFYIYDMENPTGEPEVLLLQNLEKEYYRLQFLVDTGNDTIKKEMEVSIKAGDLVGVLYDKILAQYHDPTNPESLKSLNMLCVRLVFCLYAEDAGIFGKHNMFHNYLQQFEPKNTRRELINLFHVLDTKIKDRDPYLEESLASFPYVNGGLFSDETIEIPQFTEEIVHLLLVNASADFDWSNISPTIFGAVFESTLNPETRRKGGMHYTSIENIHKLIDSLFLDDLQKELAKIKTIKVLGTKSKKLKQFQTKLASLNFLDPACGSGNFLTETYLCLRRLENEILSILSLGQVSMGFTDTEEDIKVSIHQFYGIEINDFAVTVAKTALWIAESQMLKETEIILQSDLDFLPLKTYDNIHEGNALRINWEHVIPADSLQYIIGNPPFSGSRYMGKPQKTDMEYVFGKLKNLGNLDYVTAWYWKATRYMGNSPISAAFVSTNSVAQGEQPAIFMKPLMASENPIKIDFAYRTFKWDSEANIKAHVHCVIIGFSPASIKKEKYLYASDKLVKKVTNINGYLIDAPNIFVESRNTPLCDVPIIRVGNQPIDDGNYLFSKEEMEEFIKKEPLAKNYFYPWYGSREFINKKPRYCLFLGDCSPSELRRMPECLKRIEAVKQFRLKSKRPGTRDLAETPTKFHVTNIPKDNYIVIPEVSSERRRYVPMGYMKPEVLCSNLVKIMPDGTLYHLGVLESNVHMAWMRAVCGRLEMRYRYSIGTVYNNFPWPDVSESQKENIEKTAQKILDARNKYQDCSLADLYDPLTMPSELITAHQHNDKAVMEAYGFSIKMTESDCVAALMQLYKQKTEESN